jgi:hypothetical protein
MRETALAKLIKMAGPAPARWVGQYKGWPQLEGVRKLDGLAVPEEETVWSRRSRRNPELPWALWAALRAIGVEKLVADKKAAVPEVVPGKPALALARVDWRPCGRGLRVVVSQVGGVKLAEGEKLYRLRLGKLGEEGERILVPGLTLEERLWGQDPDFTRMLKEQSLDQVMKIETTVAQGWLAADSVLGMSVLLGRLYPELGVIGPTLKRRRSGGYLDEEYALTAAGWWRLAYLAEQGVGEVEARRWRWLQQTAGRIDARTGKLGRYRHLQMTQRLAVKLMEERGLVPLGVEYSATAKLIALKSPHQMKADVLMVDPKDGHLIWGEVLRRYERELSWRSERSGFMDRQPGLRYQRMREQLLPWLATALGQAVELILREPNGVTSTLFPPEGRREQARLEEVMKTEPVKEKPVYSEVLPEDEWDY